MSSSSSSNSNYLGFLPGLLYCSSAPDEKSVSAPSAESLNFRLIKINDERVHIKVTYSPDSDKKVSVPRRVTILVLDISGSMDETSLNFGKNAYIALIRDLVTSGNSDIEFITYGSVSTVYHINEENVDAMLQTISHIGTSGMTNFAAPLRDISAIATNRVQRFGNNVDLRVMFFTDGQANQEVEATEKLLVSTSMLLKKHFEMSVVSTRALGRGSDTNIMSQLTSLGNQTGDHQYSSNSVGIMDMVARCPSFTAEVRTVSLTITDSKSREQKFKNIPMNRNDDDAFEASIFVDMKIGDDESVSLRGMCGSHDHEDFHTPVTADAFEVCDLTLKSIEHKHSKIAHEFVQRLLRREFNVELLERIKLLIDEVIAFEAGIMRMHKIIRRQMLEKSKLLKHTLEDFWMKSRALKDANNFDNESISKLLQAAHFSTKRSLNRMILKREDKGRENMAASEVKLLANSKALTPEQEIVLDNAGHTCYVTLTGFGGAVREGTALCWTGRVTRPEAAIANGALVNFHELYSSECIITFDIFTDTLSVKVNKDGYYDPDDIHNGWGFEFKDGSGVMKNAYRKNLNFVYPIYGCPEHWANAKELMPQALALIGSLNAAAQTFSYTKTIPFVIVAKAVRDLATRVTESGVQTFLSLTRTAHQLILDNNMKTVTEDFPKFLSSPQHRTASDVKDSGNVCVPSMEVFLTKLMFMKDRPDLAEAFFAGSIEEIVRRKMGNQKYADKRPESRTIATLHNYKDYIFVPKSNASASEAPFQSAFNTFAKKNENCIAVDLKSESKLESKEALPESSQSYEFKSENHDLTPAMLATVRDWEQLCEYELRQLQLCTQMYDFTRGGTLDSAFKMLDENYGVVTPEIMRLFEPLEFKLSENPKFSDFIVGNPKDVYRKCYHMILQNNFHTSHGDRIDAAVNKTYVDPFGPNSHLVVKKIVDAEIRSTISGENTKIQDAMNGVFAKVFCNTENIEVAVGVLIKHCKNVGDCAFWQLIACLSDVDRDTPLHLEKITLLVEWRYKKLVIYRTRPKNTEHKHYKWPATFRKASRLMRANRAIRKRQNLAVTSRAEKKGIAPPIVDGSGDNPLKGFRSDPDKLQRILSTEDWFQYIFRYVGIKSGNTEVRVGPPNKVMMRGKHRK